MSTLSRTQQPRILSRGLHEAGYSMAWWAALLGFILAPLMSLAVDVTRLLYVRTDLQTSVDAACEAAALAADIEYFNYTGVHRIRSGLALDYAAQAFSASVIEAELVLYEPTLTMVSIVTPTEVVCEAQANLQPLIPFSPPLLVRVAAQAKMRFLEH
jgi:uncharacterized membrane protein